jgi:hypothetical protein
MCCTGGPDPSERTSPAGLLIVVILLSGEFSESGEPVGAVNILGDPVGSWRVTDESHHTSDWIGGLPVTERAKARCLPLALTPECGREQCCVAGSATWGPVMDTQSSARLCDLPGSCSCERGAQIRLQLVRIVGTNSPGNQLSPKIEVENLRRFSWTNIMNVPTCPHCLQTTRGLLEG